jgi:hypothetical protein
MGLSVPVLSADQEAAKRLRMDDFRRSIGLPPTTLSTRDMIDELSGKQTPLVADTIASPKSFGELPSSLSGQSAPSTSMIRPPDPQIGMIPGSPRLIDVNERALNPAILNLPNTPAFEPKKVPKNLTPPQPTFAAPRRVF